MKLFQQLLLAPAALGLLTPMVASASELNIAGVTKYATEEQVTSVSQFSDVKPTDWAYQALSNLVERYGCVAGYPNGTFKGGQAMTRYEAAALLNACLDRITEVTDELKRLMAEFEKELAVLKGRVDGLEAKVGELEANQFSTTTKLKGVATMVIGGVSGSLQPAPSLGANLIREFGELGEDVDLGNYFVNEGDNITFNYDVKLNFDTSFTGKDLLRTQLRTGNASASNAFQPYANPNTGLEVFTDQCAGNNSLGNVLPGVGNGCADGVNVNRLFYQFPIGSYFTATLGAKVRQDDMLAMWPSAYPADSVLDLFTYAGARGAYSLNLGSGFGLSWKKNGWSISANYISADQTASNSYSGLGENYTITGQIGYAKENWGVAVAYTYANFSPTILGFTLPEFFGFEEDGFSSVGLSGYWTPLESKWVPSISAGFGFTSSGDPFASYEDDSWSWMVGLQWGDAFIKGNSLGMAIGSAGQVGPFGTGGIWSDLDEVAENTLAYELWYKFQVTDNISVTPAIFWVQNKFEGADDNIGALVKTTFRF